MSYYDEIYQKRLNRYGFDFKQPIYSEVKENKDILTNQTKEVKRLFRCINRK